MIRFAKKIWFYTIHASVSGDDRENSASLLEYYRFWCIKNIFGKFS
jgi:hypothetical protein